MHTLSTVLLSLAVCLAPDAAGEKPAPVGKTIEGFKLQDYLGAWHRLEDWSDRKLVVVAFLGVECPLAKRYGPRLAELAAEYEPRGVAFAGIDSNRQDSLRELAHYARLHKLRFPMLKDPGNAVADEFGAVRTPEVFVLDSRRVVCYRGRIDDQYGVGYARAGVKRRDLADALDELLAGRPVTTAVTEAVGCYIGRVRREAPRGDVTYSRHIRLILQRHCVHCHRPGQIAPFALTSYEEVAGWAETIREVIHDGRMPPWHANPEYGVFANDRRLPAEAKELVYEWVKNGAPEGDPREAPALPKFDEGWRIPQPDVVFAMPEPFIVPAQGVLPYQYFFIDPGFTEDKWIRAAEARPGNPAVVHHLILFYQPPASQRVDAEAALFHSVAAFAPGMPAAVNADGLARRVPAGSKLVFQVHYTPNGTPQADRSTAGLVFADPATVKKALVVDAAVNFQFRIPAEAPDHRVEASYRFGQDMLLYTLVPHMHLRGKSFRFDVLFPDGRREILLDVPRYDFNWQNAYVFAQPQRMPEGTELHCVARFDNSPDNPMNPDPQATVTWGDQTWEEMMIGSFEAALEEQDLSAGSPRVKPLEGDNYEVRLQYRPPKPVPAVWLAGSFNDWNPMGYRMDGPDREGRFVARLVLEQGTYEYKFVLDGRTWKADPGNPEQAGFFHNSVLRVGEAP